MNPYLSPCLSPGRDEVVALVVFRRLAGRLDEAGARTGVVWSPSALSTGEVEGSDISQVRGIGARDPSVVGILLRSLAGLRQLSSSAQDPCEHDARKLRWIKSSNEVNLQYLP